MARRRPQDDEPISVAADKLRGMVGEIEASDDRIASENKHKSSIYKRAKDEGYNVKALRKVIAARRMDEVDRSKLDEDFDLYMMHLEGVAHAHVEIIEEFDADEPDHDPETGESIEPDHFSDLPNMVTEPASSEAQVRAERSAWPDHPSQPATDPKPVTAADSEVSGQECPADLATHQPETANKLPAQESSGSTNGESPTLHKSKAAPPASVDAYVNDGEGGVERSNEVVTAGETAPTAKKLKMNREFFDAPHPACQRPEFCGGNSNLGLCEKCKVAAGIIPVVPGGVDIEHRGPVN